MTRICDNCKETIAGGVNHIEIRFIGMKKMQTLFKCTQLDFCSLKCLVEFWSEYKQ